MGNFYHPVSTMHTIIFIIHSQNIQSMIQCFILLIQAETSHWLLCKNSMCSLAFSFRRSAVCNQGEKESERRKRRIFFRVHISNSLSRVLRVPHESIGLTSFRYSPELCTSKMRANFSLSWGILLCLWIVTIKASSQSKARVDRLIGNICNRLYDEAVYSVENQRWAQLCGKWVDSMEHHLQREHIIDGM